MSLKKGSLLFSALLLCLLCVPAINAAVGEEPRRVGADAIVKDKAIPIDGNFEFRCLGDGTHPDDATAYMAATYQAIDSGMLDQVVPTTFSITDENAAKTGTGKLTLDVFQQLSDCLYWDPQSQRAVLTLRAVWKSQALMQAADYTARYFVDGQEIYSETRAVNKGAMIR